MAEWMLLALVAAGAAGVVWAVFSLMEERSSDQRLQSLVGSGPQREQRQGFVQGLLERTKNDRRRKLEESLRELQERERKQKKRVTLRQRLQRAGLQASETQFYLFSLGMGVVLAFITLVLFAGSGSMQTAFIMAGVAFFIGLLGLPMWLLRYLAHRRMQRFLHYLPDAVELMVRGLRSGLPVTDAMRTIAEEVPDPVGPEFMEVVEGQKLGIPMEQGLERMYERVPLPEVNFLSIVIAIQRETGGNLSEALSNLASVLRARKTMKLKVKAISQEAKVSAIIIGSIPFVLVGAMTFLNPQHLDPFFETTKGNIVAVLAGLWMLAGVLIMRKIINFKF